MRSKLPDHKKVSDNVTPPTEVFPEGAYSGLKGVNQSDRRTSPSKRSPRNANARTNTEPASANSIEPKKSLTSNKRSASPMATGSNDDDDGTRSRRFDSQSALGSPPSQPRFR